VITRASPSSRSASKALSRIQRWAFSTAANAAAFTLLASRSGGSAQTRHIGQLEGCKRYDATIPEARSASTKSWTNNSERLRSACRSCKSTYSSDVMHMVGTVQCSRTEDPDWLMSFAKGSRASWRLPSSFSSMFLLSWASSGMWRGICAAGGGMTDIILRCFG